MRRRARGKVIGFFSGGIRLFMSESAPLVMNLYSFKKTQNSRVAGAAWGI